MDSFLRTSFGTLPDWLVGLLLLAGACLVAVAIHGGVVRIVVRLLGPESRYAHSLILRTNGLTRLASIILVLTGAVRLTSFDPAVTNILSSGLLVAFVFLVGWIVATTVSLAADRYLARFNLG